MGTCEAPSPSPLFRPGTCVPGLFVPPRIHAPHIKKQVEATGIGTKKQINTYKNCTKKQVHVNAVVSRVPLVYIRRYLDFTGA